MASSADDGGGSRRSSSLHADLPQTCVRLSVERVALHLRSRLVLFSAFVFVFVPLLFCLFRLGSEALDENLPSLSPPAHSGVTRASRRLSSPHAGDVSALILAVGCIMVMFYLISMMPAGGGGGGGGGNGPRDFNYRIPPSWSPEHDHSYSFRAYMTDIALWVMLTDLQPHQQCAAIIMRLGGAARDMARMVTPQELMNGGVRSGVALDPVTYQLAALQERFAALDDESRLASMTEMLAFTRRQWGVHKRASGAL